LVFFPFHLIGIKKPGSFFNNCFAVFAGKATWVGYTTQKKNLPHLRKAVITCNGLPSTIRQELPQESLQLVDYWYARDYEPLTDIKLILKSYRRLGG
jgi:O-antigen biosynthesis protein